MGTGGSVRVVNGCEIRGGRVTQVRRPWRLLPLVQVVEYLRGFLFARMGWSRLNALPIISGAFGVFSRGVGVAAGGYRADTIGEDMELVVRLRRLLRSEAGDGQTRMVVASPRLWGVFRS